MLRATLTESQLGLMLEMQNSMNSKVNADWISANNDWYRAIQVEGVEGIEHHGWKWWKKQARDLEQLQMELVDIWHFILSAALQRCAGNVSQAIDGMLSELSHQHQIIEFDNKSYTLSTLTSLEKLDLLVGLSAAKRMSLVLFESILFDCEMSWIDLARQYIGKNVLNTFRQDFGYKNGTYIKIWAGREDNEHLVEILATISMDRIEVREVIYGLLKERYFSLAVQR